MGGDITRGWKGAHDRVYIPSSRSHPTPRRLFAFPIAEVNLDFDRSAVDRGYQRVVGLRGGGT